jgi:hypothetical protein
MKKSDIIVVSVAVAAMLWISFIGYKVLNKLAPTHTDTVLIEQAVYDSVKIADLQQSIDNLMNQLEASKRGYDSLKTVQTKLRNTYQHEINSITLLPWNERIRLHQDYLNKPDTAFFD